MTCTDDQHHDIMTTLAVIRGNAQLVHRRLQRIETAGVSPCLASINAIIQSSDTLTTRIAELSSTLEAPGARSSDERPRSDI